MTATILSGMDGILYPYYSVNFRNLQQALGRRFAACLECDAAKGTSQVEPAAYAVQTVPLNPRRSVPDPEERS